MRMHSLGIYNLRIHNEFWLGVSGIRKAPDDVESLLKNYTDSTSVVLTDSGRSALFIALKQLGCKGGEVLVNAYTTDVVHNTIIAAGAKPVCYDIDPHTLKPDLHLVNHLISDNTRAAIHTGLFGFPCDISSFCKEMSKADVPVIEDACNSFGCISSGRKSGSQADYSILSFRVGKPVSSGGGALLINHPINTSNHPVTLTSPSTLEDLLNTQRVILDHIMLNPFFLRFVARPIRRLTKGTKLGSLLIRGGVVDTASLPSEDSLCSIGKIQRKLVRANLKHYSSDIIKRKEAGKLLLHSIRDLPVDPVALEQHHDWNGLFFPVLLHENCDVNAFQRYCRKNGFDVSRFHYEAPQSLLGSNYEKSLPGTSVIVKRLVCIPCPEKSTVRERLIKTICEFFSS